MLSPRVLIDSNSGPRLVTLKARQESDSLRMIRSIKHEEHRLKRVVEKKLVSEPANGSHLQIA